MNQKGEEAAKHNNLFFNMTYVEDIDLSAVSDDATRQNLITQIAQYGQIPAQLLLKPHPVRYSREQALALALPSVHAQCSSLLPALVPQIVLHTRHKSPIASVLIADDHITLLDSVGRCSCHALDATACDESNFPFTFTINDKHTKRVASGLTVALFAERDE